MTEALFMRHLLYDVSDDRLAPSLTSTLSMRMTCDPPLLRRRNVSTRIANVRDSRLTAVAPAKT